MEEPGVLQSMGLQRVGHKLVTQQQQQQQQLHDILSLLARFAARARMLLCKSEKQSPSRFLS